MVNYGQKHQQNAPKVQSVKMLRMLYELNEPKRGAPEHSSAAQSLVYLSLELSGGFHAWSGAIFVFL